MSLRSLVGLKLATGVRLSSRAKAEVKKSPFCEELSFQELHHIATNFLSLLRRTFPCMRANLELLLRSIRSSHIGKFPRTVSFQFTLSRTFSLSSASLQF